MRDHAPIIRAQTCGAPTTADVLAYPLARRSGLVGRQARWFVDQAPAAAERNLARLLQMQCDTLIRKRVPEGQARREAAALEAAIRAAVARLSSDGGAAA